MAFLKGCGHSTFQHPSLDVEKTLLPRPCVASLTFPFPWQALVMLEYIVMNMEALQKVSTSSARVLRKVPLLPNQACFPDIVYLFFNQIFNRPSQH